jgi:hypothetical protein
MKYKVVAFPNPNIFQQVGETDELFSFLFVTGMLHLETNHLKVYHLKEEQIVDGIRINQGARVVFMGKEIMMVFFQKDQSIGKKILTQDTRLLFYKGMNIKDQGDFWFLRDDVCVRKYSIQKYASLKVASARLIADDILDGVKYMANTNVDFYENGNVYSGVIADERTEGGIKLLPGTLIVNNEEGNIIYAEKAGKVILGNIKDLPKRGKILKSEEAMRKSMKELYRLARKYNF